MGGWNVEICDCLKNPLMFLWAVCVPGGCCCMQAIDAKLTEENKNAGLIACLLSCCCGCIGGIINRNKLRTALEIQDTIVLDILFWAFIPCCAVTQEFMQTMERKHKNQNLPIWKALKI